MNAEPKTVAIIGGGPVGLAAAAHALERNLKPIVLEAGPGIGHAVRQWGHVRMFSPWEYNIDRAAARLLTATGWNSPDPKQYPTGDELVERYLEPLATRTALKDHIRTSSRVTDISRVGFDKLKTKGREQAAFEVRYRNGAGPESLRADAVIDASGSWSSPNAAGANGLAAVGEADARSRIAYAMPDVLNRDRARYAGRTVAVLGAGHSAVGTLIDLAQLKNERPATKVIWLVRGDNPAKAFGGGANDKLVERGLLGAKLGQLVAEKQIQVEAGFRVSHIALAGDHLRIGDGSGFVRPARDCRRADRRHGLPAGSFLPARSAPGAGPGARVPAGAGTADRPQRAQLRDGAPAWRARACTARGGFLFRRHEVVWPRADLPDADRLRTGPLDHRRHRR